MLFQTFFSSVVSKSAAAPESTPGLSICLLCRMSPCLSCKRQLQDCVVAISQYGQEPQLDVETRSGGNASGRRTLRTKDSISHLHDKNISLGFAEAPLILPCEELWSDREACESR